MSSDPEPARVRGVSIELTLPPAWEVLDVPEFDLVIASRPLTAASDGSTFRSSLNAIAVPVDPEVDIRTLGTEAIAAARITADNVHILAYDMWSHRDAAPGRRLEFTYAQGPFSLGVIQWIAIAHGLATTLTATFSVDQTQHRSALDRVADGAGLPGAAPVPALTEADR